MSTQEAKERGWMAWLGITRRRDQPSTTSGSLFRLLRTETGWPVVQAWFLVIGLCAVAIFLVWLPMSPNGPPYNPSKAEIIGIPLDRVGLAVGVIATAASALVYNIQKRIDEAIDRDQREAALRADREHREATARNDREQREELHRQDQFRYWSEPLRDRTEGLATWIVLASLAKQDMKLRGNVLRVAQDAIEQYVFDRCLNESCAEMTSPCGVHHLRPGLGEGPTRCLGELVRAGMELPADGISSIAIGRPKSHMLRPLNLGVLPAAGFPSMDLVEVRPGEGAPLMLAVQGGHGAEAPLGMPRHVPKPGRVECTVRRDSMLVWMPAGEQQDVQIEGTVHLTVERSATCILRRWILTGDLELFVGDGATVEFDECILAGNIQLLNEGVLQGVSISARRSRLGERLGVFRPPASLSLKDSTLDFGDLVAAPEVTSEVGLTLTVAASTVRLSIANESVVQGVTLAEDASVDLQARGGLRVESLEASGDVSELAAGESKVLNLLVGDLGGSANVELPTSVGSGTTASVEFFDVAAAVLALHGQKVSASEGLIVVKSVGVESGPVSVLIGDRDRRPRVSAADGTTLRWVEKE